MLRNILLLLLAAVVASTAQTSTSSSSPKMETTHVDLAWEHANNLVLTDDRAAWVADTHRHVAGDATRRSGNGRLTPYGDDLFLSFTAHGHRFSFELHAAHHLFDDDVSHSVDGDVDDEAEMVAYEGVTAEGDRCHLTIHSDEHAHASILVDGSKLFTLDHHVSLHHRLHEATHTGHAVRDGPLHFKKMESEAGGAHGGRGHVVHQLNQRAMLSMPWGFVDHRNKQVYVDGEVVADDVDVTDADAVASVMPASAAARRLKGVAGNYLSTSLVDSRFERWMSCYPKIYDTGKTYAVTLAWSYEFISRWMRSNYKLKRDGITSRTSTKFKTALRTWSLEIFHDTNLIYASQFHVWLKLQNTIMCTIAGPKCQSTGVVSRRVNDWNVAKISFPGIKDLGSLRYLNRVSDYREKHYRKSTGTLFVWTNTHVDSWIGGMAHIGGGCRMDKSGVFANGAGWCRQSSDMVSLFAHEMGHSVGSNHPFGIPVSGNYPGDRLAKLMGLPKSGATGGLMDYGTKNWKGKLQFARTSRDAICKHLSMLTLYQNLKYHPRAWHGFEGDRVYSDVCLKDKADTSWKRLQKYKNSAFLLGTTSKN